MGLFKFSMGEEVKDSITGFTGTVVCLAEFMTGCRRIGVKNNKLKDGKPTDFEMFDEDMLKSVRCGKNIRIIQPSKFELGEMVQDMLTEFKGVVVCRTWYFGGDQRVTVQSKKLKDNMPVEGVAFDENQLVSLKKKQKHKIKNPAGPQRFEASLRR